MLEMDLDASVQNSSRGVIVLYTDAGSDFDAEQCAASLDRRNPYVLQGRRHDSNMRPAASAGADKARNP